MLSLDRPLNHEDNIVVVATRDYSKLRKAAASQSLSKLKEAILAGGWKAVDIDDNDAYNQTKGQQKQRQHASKSALHMAAWKGCLENVRYLLEDVGCDINAYSKQEFSYGKTAIFFALTQGRSDITEYLLRKGAKVTIVNNKGQSVLSLAATHFKDSCTSTDGIVNTIQKLELEQKGDGWWNFRASHSDGYEYGDLDPRFLNDRPLKDTDVVTPLAINPTDQQTRKGGFLRRNPGAILSKNACGRGENKLSEQRSRKRRDRKKKDPLPVLSPEEQGQLDRAWESLLATPTPSSSSSSASSPLETFDGNSLLEILRLSDKQRSSWVPQATIRLTKRFGEDGSVRMIEESIINKLQPITISQRHLQLLSKILCRLKGGEQQRRQQKEGQQHTDDESSRSHNNIISNHNSFDRSDLWKEARSEVSTLHISCLEENDSPILALPNAPIFVDTPDVLRRVIGELSNSRLVAIDTEWHTQLPRNSNNKDDADVDGSARTVVSIKPKAALSTLQVAFWSSEENQISAYVVDLKLESWCFAHDRHPEYHGLAKTLVGNLLEACRDTVQQSNRQKLPLVLGFSISHDLPMLERFWNGESSDNDDDDDKTTRINGANTIKRREPSAQRNSNAATCYNRVLDLQSFLAKTSQKETLKKPKSSHFRSNLPGLKACVAQYSSVSLSKDCQCSDWGKRPLSKAQLDYAGLDAAILLVLLAERSGEETMTESTTITTE